MSDTFCLDCEVRGDCCYWTQIIDNHGYMSYRCPFLMINGLCSIYDRRHKINPLCLTVEESIDKGLFPDKCKYILTSKKVNI